MKYISADTYDIFDEELEHTFPVDDLISETISILNKKGYKTRFCCSGHLSNNDSIIEEIDIKDLPFYLDYDYAIKEQNGNKYIVEKFLQGNSTYIAFELAIDLPTIPEFFTLDSKFNSISSKVDWYEGQNKIPDEEVYELILKLNYTLLCWARLLPNLAKTK